MKKDKNEFYTKVVHVRITQKDFDLLNSITDQNKTVRSDIVRKLIKRYIKNFNTVKTP